jgi:hypothetical protein
MHNISLLSVVQGLPGLNKITNKNTHVYTFLYMVPGGYMFPADVEGVGPARG